MNSPSPDRYLVEGSLCHSLAHSLTHAQRRSANQKKNKFLFTSKQKRTIHAYLGDGAVLELAGNSRELRELGGL
jgi:hypothetical protein